MGGGMARAVIKLDNDISSYLPYLDRQIEGCAYNREVGLIGFRKDNMVVIIHPLEIAIHKIVDEADALKILDWLKDILDNAEETRSQAKGGL